MYYVKTFVRITDTQHLRDVVEAYAKVGIDEPSLWIKEDMKKERTSIVAVFPFTKKELYATDTKTSHRTLKNTELFLLYGELKSIKETEQNITDLWNKLDHKQQKELRLQAKALIDNFFNFVKE